MKIHRKPLYPPTPSRPLLIPVASNPPKAPLKDADE